MSLIAITSVVDLHLVRGHRPAFDEYIGRAVKGTEFQTSSIWANPFTPHNYSPKAGILAAYEFWIKERIREDPVTYNLETLRGKRLGCWCITTSRIDNLVCHGQILLKLLREGYYRHIITEREKWN